MVVAAGIDEDDRLAVHVAIQACPAEIFHGRAVLDAGVRDVRVVLLVELQEIVNAEQFALRVRIVDDAEREATELRVAMSKMPSTGGPPASSAYSTVAQTSRPAPRMA